MADRKRSFSLDCLSSDAGTSANGVDFLLEMFPNELTKQNTKISEQKTKTSEQNTKTSVQDTVELPEMADNESFPNLRYDSSDSTDESTGSSVQKSVFDGNAAEYAEMSDDESFSSLRYDSSESSEDSGPDLQFDQDFAAWYGFTELNVSNVVR